MMDSSLLDWTNPASHSSSLHTQRLDPSPDGANPADAGETVAPESAFTEAELMRGRKLTCEVGGNPGGGMLCLRARRSRRCRTFLSSLTGILLFLLPCNGRR